MHYSKSQLPHPFLHHIKEFNIPAGSSSPHRAQIELLFKNSLLFTISIPFVGDSSERASSRKIIAYVCAPSPRRPNFSSVRKGLSAEAQYKIPDQNTRRDPF
jgi:hypothetical protein